MKIIYSAFYVPSKISPHREWLGMPSCEEFVIMAEASYGKARLTNPDAEIVLYCDQHFKNILGHIPYDDIEVLDIYLPATMWAGGKFYAMEKQDTEFYHIDFDLFLGGKIPSLEHVGLSWEGYYTYKAYPALLI